MGQSVLLDCSGPTLKLRARVLRHEGQSTVGGAAISSHGNLFRTLLQAGDVVFANMPSGHP